MNIPSAAIADRLVKSGHSDADAKRAVELYGMLVGFAADHPDQMIAPPHLADQAWHEHLEMESYERDCVKACGRVLGHNAEVFDTPEFWKAWELSRDLYGGNGVELPNRHGYRKGDQLRPSVCFVFEATAKGL